MCCLLLSPVSTSGTCVASLRLWAVGTGTSLVWAQQQELQSSLPLPPCTELCRSSAQLLLLQKPVTVSVPQRPGNQLSSALSTLQREVPAAPSNVSQLAAPSNSMLAKHWMLATPENDTLDSCTALDDLFSSGNTIDHMLGSGMGAQHLNSSSRGSSQDMQSGQVGHADDS